METERTPSTNNYDNGIRGASTSRPPSRGPLGPSEGEGEGRCCIQHVMHPQQAVLSLTIVP